MYESLYKELVSYEIYLYSVDEDRNSIYIYIYIYIYNMSKIEEDLIKYRIIN